MKTKNTSHPLIGIVCDMRKVENAFMHAAGLRYLKPLCEQTNAATILIPCLMEKQDETVLDTILERIDGIMLTGSPANVHPDFYGGIETPKHAPFDRVRDQTSLKTIEKTLERKLPLLAICRGFQELNVAQGGSLNAQIAKIHHPAKSDDKNIIFAARHKVNFKTGGKLHQIINAPEAMVNSVHVQGVDRLGNDIDIEATDADGLVEAISIRNHPFAIGVQWHPEYQPQDNITAKPLYAAFIDAVNKNRA